MKNETALNSVSTAGLQDAAPITSEIKPKKSPCEYYNGYLKVSAQKKTEQNILLDFNSFSTVRILAWMTISHDLCWSTIKFCDLHLSLKVVDSTQIS